ncbi:MAG: DUF4956 domain-containing protein [Oscillospiraceae bacterium]|nr:DUF4956 domain-containing protein [Oscillospiraceae bacterium]
MNFSDIFKKSFLEGFAATDINIYTASAAMLITSVLALYIFLVYRTLTRKTFYSKSFNISLAGIALITAGIIVTIQSSLVVSLGMVGALSIVRFRTAVKDPMDLMFLFWSIAVGIICGVGLAEIAVLLSVILTVGIVVLDLLPVAKAPMILVVNAVELNAEQEILEVVRRYAKHHTVKSRNLTRSSLDLIIELRVSDGSELMQTLMQLDSVETASLMSHDGEVSF